MDEPVPEANPPGRFADFDQNGVDRQQIRHMLAKSPRERVRWLEDTWRAIERVRELNDVPKLR
jgi:hypothetical protein